MRAKYGEHALVDFGRDTRSSDGLRGAVFLVRPSERYTEGKQTELETESK